MDNTEVEPMMSISWKQGWSSKLIISLSLVVAIADIERFSVRKSKLAVLNFFAFFFLSQLLGNYEVVAQKTFDFVPFTLLPSDLKLVEARTWYLNFYLRANSM